MRKLCTPGYFLRIRSSYSNSRVNWKEYGYTGSLKNWRDVSGPMTYRPYVTIYIHNGSARIPVEALVDSGSDGMVIHAGLAKELEIDPDKCPHKNLGGATGLREGFTALVSYEVDGFPKDTIETKAIFIPDLPVACLVGQEDLFEKFIVQFEKSNNVLKLSKVSK